MSSQKVIGAQDEPRPKVSRQRQDVPHDPSICLLCSRNNSLMRVECVADLLGLAQITVYTGAGGTECLFERRIHQGRNVRWLRARVMAHKQARDEFGMCSGQCKEAVPPGREERPLELVQKAG